MTENPPSGQQDNRLTQVESLLSHLQHDVDKLNDALIDQQSRIDQLREQLSRMESVIEQLPQTPQDPEQERPPHY